MSTVPISWETGALVFWLIALEKKNKSSCREYTLGRCLVDFISRINFNKWNYWIKSLLALKILVVPNFLKPRKVLPSTLLQNPLLHHSPEPCQTRHALQI